MVRIEKKVWPEYFQKILEGKKRCEVRLADWECKEKDILILKEWNPDTKAYTGRVQEKKVTYVGKTRHLEEKGWWKKEDIDKYGYQIISFE